MKKRAGEVHGTRGERRTMERAPRIRQGPLPPPALGHAAPGSRGGRGGCRAGHAEELAQVPGTR
ncbi:Hypothetical protein CAP_0079 [Chondromyces apiculatus DSM 436]|uniref:Uncharacterized protein n=1 Tax=Chondromyces apiculatus DSM 436 TaxID=1192034 RepID=A0A017TJI0_9BACT|nr:Hypothetical protein CAP_0079 [Chondromyces apiculatus DSM 436]